MIPSSTLCHAQEQYHRRRAEGAVLENERAVATAAAAAWAQEGLSAERRERRTVRAQAASDAAHTPEGQPPEDERPFSENPDRGFAEPRDDE